MTRSIDELNPGMSSRARETHKMNLPESYSRRLICCVLVGASLCLLAGCDKSVLNGGPVDGVVLDATTQQPIANAMVVVKWHGYCPQSTATACLAITSNSRQQMQTAGITSTAGASKRRGMRSGSLKSTKRVQSSRSLTSRGMRRPYDVKMIRPRILGAIRRSDAGAAALSHR